MPTSRRPPAPLRLATGAAVPPRGVPALLLGFGLVAGGCLCSEERPYTPFGVTTALPATTADEPPAPSAESQGQPLESVGLVAPKDAREWTVFERTLIAGREQTFRTALLVPGEPPKVVAWLESARPSGSDGLWLMSEAGTPESLVYAAPTDLPLGAGCERTPRLVGAGRGLLLRLDVACKEALLSGSNVARYAALGFSPTPRALLELTRVERKRPVPLDLRATVSDLDGDAKDDLTLVVTALDEAGKPSSEALRFEWLARPAGLSRIAGEPAKSIDKRAGALLVQAVRKAERGAVPGAVARLRGLFAAMCAESASPEYVTRTSALGCGTLGGAYDKITRASVTAELGLGHRLRALGEASRLGAVGAGGDAERKLLRDLVHKSITRVSPEIELQRQFALGEREVGTPTRVAFDREGRLFVRSAVGAELVWPPQPAGLGGAGETPAPSWLLLDRHPSGRTFVGVFASCEGPSLEFGIRDGSGAPLPLFPIPAPSPRPLPCLATRPPHLPFALLGYTHTGVIFTAYYEPFGTSEEELAKATLAYPTPFGLAVARGPEVELWDLEGGVGELECAANETRTHAACLGGGTRLTLLRKPPK